MVQQPLKRPDIEGLRALAVLAVVTEHTFATPSGGFLGVDVFFVISGYLITRSLLDEVHRTGRIRIGRFWLRRVRRLAPAFLAMAGTTAVALLLLFPSQDPVSLLTPLGAAVASVSNWWFISQGTDYFGGFDVVSPFQHTWSLSVEEQFYALWPLLIVLSTWIVRRRTGTVRSSPLLKRLLLAFLTLAVCSSLAAAFVTSVDDPQTAYFSTATRAWELAAGAMLAVFIGSARPVSERSGLVLVIGGMTLIVSGMVFFAPSVPMPVPGAVPAVVGTVLVLVGGRSPRGGTWLLENRVSRFFGRISYSLYLWHFPILIIVQQVHPEALWSVIPVSCAFAAASFSFIERPMLAGGARTVPSSLRRTFTAAGTIASTAVAMAAIGAALPTSTVITAPAHAAPTPTSSVDARQESLERALRETNWDTALHDDGRHPGGPDPRDCGRLSLELPEEKCTFGASDAEHTVVLVGDSIAGAWSEAVIELMRTTRPSRKVVVLARNGCPFIDAEVQRGIECGRVQQQVIDRVADLRPDAVIIGSRMDGIPFEQVDGRGVLTASQFERASASMLEELRGTTGVVLQLTAPPAGKDPARCHVRFGSPQACTQRVSQEWLSRMASTERVADKHDVRLVDTRPLVSVDGLTPGTADGAFIRTDAVHVTPSFSRASAPALGELIDEAGGLDPR
ncbi:acyltransferase family protein [Curtobacterium pusillum]|nr:acyltransferase family protein [Curtobacterium pusillum]